MPCDDSPFWLRFDGSNVTTAAGTGRWHFVHGPALDDPVIGLNRKPNGTTLELYFVTDGNGRQVAVGKGDGNFNPCDQGECSENLGWSHAGASSNSGTFDVSRMAAAGAPGLSFFRNRIYDQATGRWTQEDPIGIAGGVNLYQYAGNNPVMYTDPFGLAPGPCSNKSVLQCIKLAITAVQAVFGAGPATTPAEERLTPEQLSGPTAPDRLSQPENDSDRFVSDLEEGSRRSERAHQNVPQGGSKVGPATEDRSRTPRSFSSPGRWLPGGVLLIICAPCVEHGQSALQAITGGNAPAPDA